MIYAEIHTKTDHGKNAERQRRNPETTKRTWLESRASNSPGIASYPGFWHPGQVCSAVLLLSRFSCVRLCATHRRQPTRLPRPWDSPGKNTGVRCHFLLQCMKVKSESEVARLCPTLSDPMDCSLPGSSVLGIFQALVETKSKTRAHLFQDCNDF